MSDVEVTELVDVLQDDINPTELKLVVEDCRDNGVTFDAMASTVVAEAQAAIDAGDLIKADAILFHAVHAGIRPSVLLIQSRTP